jgi:hypothetical protein
MAEILDLPPELVLRIIDMVYLDDLDNFTSCCKAIRGLADKALEQHREMKKNCSTISCGSMSGGLFKVAQHPVMILHAILEDSLYRFYPQTIRVDSCLFQTDEGYEDEHDDQVLSEVDAILMDLDDGMFELLEECPYLKGTDEFSEWYYKWLDDDGGFCIALALTMLPNVRALTITDYSGARGPVLAKMVEKIVRANVESVPASPAALSKLSQVRILGTNDDFFEDFAMCALFTVLPSMRSISGTQILGEDFHWTFEAQLSEIKEVAFEDSAISASSFGEFLKGIKALQRFKYQRTDAYFDFSFWQPRDIIASLLGNTKDSLEELDLTFVNPWYSDISLADSALMGSLRSFNNLKRIRVNVAMFCDEGLEKQKEQGIYVGPVRYNWQDIDGIEHYCTISDGGDDSDDTSTNDHQLLPFLDILPASTEKLTLVGFFTKGEATLLFSGMSTLKGEQLPKLSEISLEAATPSANDLDYKDMRTICDELGITLRRTVMSP